jgi:hypothetical protein
MRGGLNAQADATPVCLDECHRVGQAPAKSWDSSRLKSFAAAGATPVLSMPRAAKLFPSRHQGFQSCQFSNDISVHGRDGLEKAAEEATALSYCCKKM